MSNNGLIGPYYGMDVEQELFDALHYECAVEILRQEVPDITDDKIAEIVAMDVVKSNWANAVPVYHIMKDGNFELHNVAVVKENKDV